VVAYLSPAWIDALAETVAGDASVQAQARAGELGLGITQVVTRNGAEAVVYHITARDGSVVAGAGPADPEDVRFEQDEATARAVAEGRRNAQEALITGRIRFRGDREALVAARDLLAALDAALAPLRARTERG
jgi:putative sterol carrier protein